MFATRLNDMAGPLWVPGASHCRRSTSQSMCTDVHHLKVATFDSPFRPFWPKLTETTEMGLRRVGGKGESRHREFKATLPISVVSRGIPIVGSHSYHSATLSPLSYMPSTEHPRYPACGKDHRVASAGNAYLRGRMPIEAGP